MQMVYRKSIVIPRIPTVVKLNGSCCLICSCDNGPGGIDVEEYTMTLKLHSIATFESYFILPHENLLAYYLNSLSLSCRFAWRRRTSHMLVKYMLASVSKICSFSSQLGIWTGIKGRYHLPSLSVIKSEVRVLGTSIWLRPRNSGIRCMAPFIVMKFYAILQDSKENSNSFYTLRTIAFYDALRVNSFGVVFTHGGEVEFLPRKPRQLPMLLSVSNNMPPHQLWKFKYHTRSCK